MQKKLKDIFNNTTKFDEAGNKKKKYHEDLYKVKVSHSKDDVTLLNIFLAQIIFYGKKHEKKCKSQKYFNTGRINYISQKNQRVTFKMSYSPKLDVHKAYLSTYMPQNNKNYVEEKPILFGSDPKEYETNLVGKHYKCILSPENQNINLKVLCSQFIKRIETMTGFKLYWQGAIHNDTEHRHAHICINGIDQSKKKVYFQSEMISRTMRETLSYIATQMVGERTTEEIQVAQKNLITAQRWTNLDQQIEKYGNKISKRMLEPQIQNRLSFLTKIGIVVKKDKYYQVNKNWKEVLIATGRFNTFLPEYQNHGGNLELYTGGKITGTVEKIINFDKDESWSDAILVKNSNGKNYYVPVSKIDETLQGKMVCVDSEKMEKLQKVQNENIKEIEK